LVLLCETIEVIKHKFRGSLEVHRAKHGSRLKDLLNKYGISTNREAVVAYLLGVLRAIAYDSKTFVQSEGLEWDEFEELVDRVIDEVMKTADDIAKDG